MPTPPGPLARTNYLSWPPGPYNAEADPNSPSYNPSAVLPVDGYQNYGDSALDSEQYFRSLERVHGMNLHAPGVGSGMQIACTKSAPNVTVMPGTALDASGKHIFLAEGGQAEIGPDADVPETPPVLASVTASGVVLPTAGYTGTYFVAVQWWETWDSAAYASDPNVQQYNDTPWLQLITAAEYNADVHVVLGEVVLDGSSNVTSASYGVAGGLQRTSVSIPAQSVQFQRAITTAAPGADTAGWAEIRAREAGGIEMLVAKTSDQVTVAPEGGGTFSTMVVGANNATFGNTSTPGIQLNGAEATIRVGAHGNYGDVLVYDNAANLTVSLVGDTGHVIVGGSQVAGEVRMFNAGASETMTLEGSNGAAVVQHLQAFQNGLIDVDTTFLHVHGTDLCLDGRSHKNNRALVDWGNQLVINFNHDYGNGVVINGLQNPVGQLGMWGEQGTQIGIISGYIGAKSGNDNPVYGNVTLNFSNLTFSSASGDFDGSQSYATGFQGTFTATPHVLFVTNEFALTTDDVWTEGWFSAYTDHVDFTWGYNCPGDGHQQWQLFVIGPIASPY